MANANTCVFCRIVAGEIPSPTLYEDDEFIAFRDLNPVASTHVLIIPKRHIEALASLDESDAKSLGKMALIAPKIAAAEKLSGGYRLITNQGKDAGQLVDHLHWHVIGGNRLGKIG